MDDCDHQHDEQCSDQRQLHLPLGPPRGYKSRSRTRHLHSDATCEASPASAATGPNNQLGAPAVHGQYSGTRRPSQGFTPPTAAAQHMLAAAELATLAPPVDCDGFKAPAPIHPPHLTAAVATAASSSEPRVMKPTLFGYLGRLLSNPAKALSRGGASSAAAGSVPAGSAGARSAGHSAQIPQPKRPSLGSLDGSSWGPRQCHSMGLIQQKQLQPLVKLQEHLQQQQHEDHTNVTGAVAASSTSLVGLAGSRLQLPGATGAGHQNHQRLDYSRHPALPLGNVVPPAAAAAATPAHASDNTSQRKHSAASHSPAGPQHHQLQHNGGRLRGHSSVGQHSGDSQQQQQMQVQGVLEVVEQYQDPCLHHTHGDSSVKPVRTRRRRAPLSAHAAASGGGSSNTLRAPAAAAGATTLCHATQTCKGTSDSLPLSPASSPTPPAAPAAVSDHATSPSAFATPGAPQSKWRHTHPVSPAPAADVAAGELQSLDDFATPGAHVTPGNGMWQSASKFPEATVPAANGIDSRSSDEFVTPGPVCHQLGASPLTTAAAGDKARPPAQYSTPRTSPSSGNSPASAAPVRAASLATAHVCDCQTAATPSAGAAGYSQAGGSLDNRAAEGCCTASGGHPAALAMAAAIAGVPCEQSLQHAGAAAATAQQQAISTAASHDQGDIACAIGVDTGGLAVQPPLQASVLDMPRQEQHNQQQQQHDEEDYGSEGGEQFRDAQEDAFAADPLSPHQQYDMQHLRRCRSALHGAHRLQGHADDASQPQQQQGDTQEEGPEVSTAAGGRSPNSSAFAAAAHECLQQPVQSPSTHRAAAGAGAGRYSFSPGTAADSDADEPLPSNAMPGWPDLPLGPQARAAAGLSPECSACKKPTPAAATGYSRHWHRQQHQQDQEAAADDMVMGVDWHNKRLNGVPELMQPRPDGDHHWQQLQHHEQQQHSLPAGADAACSAEEPEASLVTALEHHCSDRDASCSKQLQEQLDEEEPPQQQQQQQAAIQPHDQQEEEGLLVAKDPEEEGAAAAAGPAAVNQATAKACSTVDPVAEQRKAPAKVCKEGVAVISGIPTAADGAVSGEAGVLEHDVMQHQQSEVQQYIRQQKPEVWPPGQHQGKQKQQQQQPALTLATKASKEAQAVFSSVGTTTTSTGRAGTDTYQQQPGDIAAVCSANRHPQPGQEVEVILPTWQQQEHQHQQQTYEPASKADLLLLQAQLQLQRSQQQRRLQQVSYTKKQLQQTQEVEAGSAPRPLAVMPPAASVTAAVGVDLLKPVIDSAVMAVLEHAMLLQLPGHCKYSLQDPEVPADDSQICYTTPAGAVAPAPTLSPPTATDVKAAVSAGAGVPVLIGCDSLLSPSHMLEDDQCGHLYNQSPSAATLPTPAAAAAQATVTQALASSTATVPGESPQCGSPAPRTLMQLDSTQLPLVVADDEFAGPSGSYHAVGKDKVANSPSGQDPGTTASAAAPAVTAQPAAVAKAMSTPPVSATAVAATSAAVGAAVSAPAPLSPEQPRVLAASVFADMVQQLPATIAAVTAASPCVPSLEKHTAGRPITPAGAPLCSAAAAATELTSPQRAVAGGPATAAATPGNHAVKQWQAGRVLSLGPVVRPQQQVKGPASLAQAPFASAEAEYHVDAASGNRTSAPTSAVAELKTADFLDSNPVLEAPRARTCAAGTAAGHVDSEAAAVAADKDLLHVEESLPPSPASPTSVPAAASAPTSNTLTAAASVEAATALQLVSEAPHDHTGIQHSPALQAAAALSCPSPLGTTTSLGQTHADTAAAVADGLGQTAGASPPATPISSDPGAAAAGIRVSTAAPAAAMMAPRSENIPLQEGSADVGANVQHWLNGMHVAGTAAGEELCTLAGVLTDRPLGAIHSTPADECGSDRAEGLLVAAASAAAQVALGAATVTGACIHTVQEHSSATATAAGSMLALTGGMAAAHQAEPAVTRSVDGCFDGGTGDGQALGQLFNAVVTSSVAGWCSIADQPKPGPEVLQLQPMMEAKAAAAVCPPTAAVGAASQAAALPAAAAAATAIACFQAALGDPCNLAQLPAAEAQQTPPAVVVSSTLQSLSSPGLMSIDPACPAQPATIPESNGVQIAAVDCTQAQDDETPQSTAVLDLHHNPPEPVQGADPAVAAVVAAAIAASACAGAVNGSVDDTAAAGIATAVIDAKSSLLSGSHQVKIALRPAAAEDDTQAAGGALDQIRGQLTTEEAYDNARAISDSIAAAQDGTAAAAAAESHTPVASPLGTPCGTPLFTAVQQSLVMVDQLVDHLCHSDSAADSPAGVRRGSMVGRQHTHSIGVSHLMLSMTAATVAAAAAAETTDDMLQQQHAQDKEQQQQGARVLGSRARQLILADLNGWFDEGNEQQRQLQLQAWGAAAGTTASPLQQGLDGDDHCHDLEIRHGKKRSRQWLHNWDSAGHDVSSRILSEGAAAAAVVMKRARCTYGEVGAADVADSAVQVLPACTAGGIASADHQSLAPQRPRHMHMLPGFLCALEYLGVDIPA